MSEILYFDDLQVGHRWRSPARTVTETDVVNFAGLTGDFDPLHVDHEFAAQTPFKKPIAHGLLGLSLLAGLSSTSPRVRTVALVAVREWKFQKPVYFGDTLHVLTEVVEKRPNGRRSGHVTWRRQLINQRGEIVQDGILETLVSTTIARTEQPAFDPAASPEQVSGETAEPVSARNSPK